MANTEHNLSSNEGNANQNFCEMEFHYPSYWTFLFKLAVPDPDVDKDVEKV